jgi:hypothetical protein
MHQHLYDGTIGQIFVCSLFGKGTVMKTKCSISSNVLTAVQSSRQIFPV